MSLAIDRRPFNTILMEGQGLLGGAMLPKPVGEWGMPPEMVSQLTGYDAATEKNIAEAQAIMQRIRRRILVEWKERLRVGWRLVQVGAGLEKAIVGYWRASLGSTNSLSSSHR
jgi:hypothetical protein